MQYSETEFEALYKRCFPPAMMMAMSLLHQEDEARDVVQDVFVKLWESNFSVANPMAFVMRATRNASLNRISMLDTREKIRQRMTLELPSEESPPHRSDEEVMSAINQSLTTRERQILEKVYSDGLSYKETAENLGVSVTAVNKNVVNALKKLRCYFKVRKS